MSLEASIHERWQAEAELWGAVPAAQVFSGAAHGDAALPYVVLERLGERVTARTSSGLRLWEVRLRFAVFAANLAGVKQTLSAVRGAFERQPLSLASGECLVFQALGGDELLEESGVWRGRVDFQALVAES